MRGNIKYQPFYWNPWYCMALPIHGDFTRDLFHFKVLSRLKTHLQLWHRYGHLSCVVFFLEKKSCFLHVGGEPLVLKAATSWHPVLNRFDSILAVPGRRCCQVGWVVPGWEFPSSIILGKFHHDLTVLPRTGIMVNKGNHPQMAARFRLVKYYNLPR
jgi:hypothetical protein